MGHRANFVIIQDGDARLYGGSWAAVDCVYHFAAGPEAARENAVAKWETDAFYDWEFAEGGYLVDFDRQLAIGFGDSIPDDEIRVADRQAHPNIGQINETLVTGKKEFLEYAALFWPGWTLVWDDRGVDAFSEYLQQNSIDSIATSQPRHSANVSPPVRIEPNSN